MTNPNDFQQMHQSSIFKKTKWSPEEDNLLRESIAKNGTSNWTVVASGCCVEYSRSGGRPAPVRVGNVFE